MNPASPSPRMRLLLVGDSHELFARVILLLDEIAPNRYALDWASSCPFALSLLQRAQFAMCLATFRIGNQCGADLIRKMRAMNCHTPVVLLGSMEELAEQPAAHAYDHLDCNRLSASILHQAIRDAAAHRPGSLTTVRLPPLLPTGCLTPTTA